MIQGTEYPPLPALKKELSAAVREVIGPMMSPDETLIMGLLTDSGHGIPAAAGAEEGAGGGGA